MLFRREFLAGIAAGKVTLAFRRWRRPSVKVGGTLLTPAGQLSILAVDPIDATQLKLRDAKLAGFDSLEALHADLSQQRAGQLYRIRFRRIGDDPRLELRENDRLATSDINELIGQMQRLDQRSSVGDWTMRVLKLIQQHPEESAASLANRTGFEKEWLKLNIRKLKNLGLTESLNPGYRLSPRGRSFLVSSNRESQRKTPRTK